MRLRVPLLRLLSSFLLISVAREPYGLAAAGEKVVARGPRSAHQHARGLAKATRFRKRAPRKLERAGRAIRPSASSRDGQPVRRMGRIKWVDLKGLSTGYGYIILDGVTDPRDTVFFRLDDVPLDDVLDVAPGARVAFDLDDTGRRATKLTLEKR